MTIKHNISQYSGLSMMVLLLAVFMASPVFADRPNLDLNSYKGKIVYVDFWASWCLPCKKSFPWMQEMQTKYQQSGLQIIAVNLDEDQAEADRFLSQYDVNFEVIRDPEGTLAEFYSLKGMPTALLFDADGKLISRHIGFNTNKKGPYEAQIKGLLSTSKLSMAVQQ